MRSSLALALSTGAVIGAVLAPAAAADAAAHGPAAISAAAPAPGPQPGGDPATTVTFTVTTGGLTLTAPASADLGSGAPGTIISSAIGTVTVTDDRALLDASWIATASSTDFITAGGGTNKTIPVGDATYTPGEVTTTGTITATPSTITLSGIPQTVVAGTAGSGNNTASWNPTIAVSVPSTAVGGAYAATLTESVS